MRSHSFLAMGTTWWVTCDRSALLAEAERMVREVEQDLSRFRAGSAVSRLNRERELRHLVLAEVVRKANWLAEVTGGAFTPTLGRELRALGYDRSFDQLHPGPALPVSGGPTRVEVRGDQVVLSGPGELDLGGIAKGWTVDRVHDHLRAAGASAVLVDGGGDVRGSGRSWPIGAGGDHAVSLDGGAVATSSTLVRSWQAVDGQLHHHIVDPRTGRSSTGSVCTATVCAADAATADALATAVIVDPQGVLPLLAGLGARALVWDAAGHAWATPEWKEAA